MNLRANLRSRLMVIALALLVGVTVNGAAGADLSRVDGQAGIEGEDHAVLKGYFSRWDEGKAHRPPDGPARAVLLARISGVDKDGFGDVNDQSGQDQGKTTSEVEVLFVDVGKEGKPIRALIAYGRLRKMGEHTYREEGLASLTVHENHSTLAVIPADQAPETCGEVVSIGTSKEVRIGGKALVGLMFTMTKGNPNCQPSTSAVREERINFFLFDDREIKPAGSVLVFREETGQGPDGGRGRRTYSAGLVFKKDMKGNIIGILSPFAVTAANGRNDKGMVRFEWNGNRREFIREGAPQSDSRQTVGSSSTAPGGKQ